VFLAVVGAVMLSLESFSRLGYRAGTETSDHAMDIDPSRDAELTPDDAGAQGKVI
jgi:multicomponent K+:H+ antiporter subunit A